MTKALVAYFSAGGTTAGIAKYFAGIIGADVYEIRPEVPYTKADLNWMDKKSRSSVEMKDPSSRPALADTDADIAAYDVIFLGFPIWWYTAPTIIHTFLEAYDFSGKTIVPFATSGGSSLGDTEKTLQQTVPHATVKGGRMLNGHPAEAALKDWAAGFGL